MKILLSLAWTCGLTVALTLIGYAQPAFYDVYAVSGNGLRFWSMDEYKLHMGAGTEYNYGPVYGFAIKSNVANNYAPNGWCWGTMGQTPVAALNVGGDMQIAGKFVATSIGIGTTSPAMSLDVSGFGARVRNPGTGGSDYTTFRVQGPNYANGLEIDFFGNSNYTGTSYGGGIGSVSIVNVNAKPLVFGTNNAARMTIDGGGNIGIGTSSPTQKLTVNGTIYGKQVKVDLSVPGPDYVFEKSYSLPTLYQVKSYIDENKHLPEVPSAKEMEANGINVGEMNMLLLKKVEELTLYMIEQQKQIDELKKNHEK